MGSPRNQATNIPGLYAIGECDYQYHGANRLGANSLLSCIFSGLMVAPSIENGLKSLAKGSAADLPASLFGNACRQHQERHENLLKRTGGENPYLLQQELGKVMTTAATVVRHNHVMQSAYQKVCELQERANHCSLSDTGNWSNQNVVFTKALIDMFPLARVILKGAIQRDESRGAHFKPDFTAAGIQATDPAGKRREAEQWCQSFEESTAKWLKTTVAKNATDGEPIITYEEVDTSLIPPRPRMYGLVGAEVIEEVWKERHAARQQGGAPAGAKPVLAGA